LGISSADVGVILLDNLDVDTVLSGITLYRSHCGFIAPSLSSFYRPVKCCFGCAIKPARVKSGIF
jgi:hypothetical protein